ncbi:MAG TPA: hypothetical protein VH062_26720 [Polyangiaceae bacterium]|jgi:uncharacterized repeat protein (TIGR03806 family)|nr:hypothetical protein [Polyangiaceae bacterium]
MAAFDETRLFTAAFLGLLAAACGSDGSPGSGNAGGAAGVANGAGGSAGTANTTGGAANGGASSGGASTGGVPSSGGASTGGAASGGTPGSGGAANGGHDAGIVDGGDVDASAPTNCAPPHSLDAPLPRLSQTGCMDPTDTKKLAPYVLPYEVNSPLWSDSADKSRGMRLPDGGKIHVKKCTGKSTECLDAADDGKWVLPVGTVMVKNFLFDGKLVETRLFEHFDAATWVGYTYQWDEAQTDATIVPDEQREVMFDTGTRKVDWHYPSRLDCLQCHNPAGGYTLGPETAQMNRTVNGKNQIDVWAAMGLFETKPATPYAAALVLPYAGQLGTPPANATAEARARSYLHANCAFCHRPDGDFSVIDTRAGVAFKNMGLCNATPTKGDVGVNGALDVVPGKPAQSVLWLRMDALPNLGRMPKLASYQIDDQGVKVVGDWITALPPCP